MASVFLAKQAGTGRLVAVKIMSAHLQAEARWADRFLDEARRLAELAHPNIVPVFDWGSHEGVGYIVMEYMRGGDLTHRLRSIPMTVRDAIDICCQIASGLDFAGEKGYVHRDIKPDNILFRENGSPCILDFGISKEVSSNTTHSSQGIAIGTGAYMSPEQASPGQHALDRRSDLYSLGIMLFEMLTGTRPFEYRHLKPSEAFLLYVSAHSNMPPPPLPERFQVFQPIVDRLLAKIPADRFARGRDVRSALMHLEATLPESFLEHPLRDLPAAVAAASQPAADPEPSLDTEGRAARSAPTEGALKPVGTGSGAAAPTVVLPADGAFESPASEAVPTLIATRVSTEPTRIADSTRFAEPTRIEEPARIAEAARSASPPVSEPLTAPASGAAVTVIAPAEPSSGSAAVVATPPPSASLTPGSSTMRWVVALIVLVLGASVAYWLSSGGESTPPPCRRAVRARSRAGCRSAGGSRS
jgi:serine/threonine protein kinase